MYAVKPEGMYKPIKSEQTKLTSSEEGTLPLFLLLLMLLSLSSLIFFLLYLHPSKTKCEINKYKVGEKKNERTEPDKHDDFANALRQLESKHVRIKIHVYFF